MTGVTTTEWRVTIRVAPGDVRTRYVIADTREEAIRLAAGKLGLTHAMDITATDAVFSARWVF